MRSSSTFKIHQTQVFFRTKKAILSSVLLHCQVTRRVCPGLVDLEHCRLYFASLKHTNSPPTRALSYFPVNLSRVCFVEQIHQKKDKCFPMGGESRKKENIWLPGSYPERRDVSPQLACQTCKRQSGKVREETEKGAAHFHGLCVCLN